jgi:hypothetical protein
VASSVDRIVVGIAAGCALLISACSVGKGQGMISGIVSAPECEIDGEYDLEPDFFVAEAIDHATEIRIQRGSDWEVYSDGMIIFVYDATEAAAMPGATLQIGPREEGSQLVDITFYLNETCRVMARRDDTPVALRATGGTITFDKIYAPLADERVVETDAVLTDVTFLDEYSPSPRTATLSGTFTFLYNRGRPAQRFP